MNNSIHVNSVDVPDNDLMATNGVVHVVKNILYPASKLHHTDDVNVIKSTVRVFWTGLLIILTSRLFVLQTFPWAAKTSSFSSGRLSSTSKSR